MLQTTGLAKTMEDNRTDKFISKVYEIPLIWQKFQDSFTKVAVIMDSRYDIHIS